MTGAIFLGGTARRKSSDARSQVCRSVSGPTRSRPAPSLGWPGERKSIGATSPGSQKLGGASRNLGPGPPEAWGPGHQSGLPKLSHLPPVFRRSEKSGEGVGHRPDLRSRSAA